MNAIEPTFLRMQASFPLFFGGFRRLAVIALLAFTALRMPAQSVPPAAPDIPDQLDLKTALLYALENNFDIRQAKESIREQEGLIVEVKAQALPNVSLDSSYTRTASDLADQGPGLPMNEQNWEIGLNVRQTLYAGGGVRASLEAQRFVREAALLDLRSVIGGVFLTVRVKFCDVLLARDQIQVQEQNVQLVEQQLRTARDRFEAGAVSNFDVLRAEVALANAKPSLIRARNRYRTAIDELRQALGYTNRTPDNLYKVPEFVGALDFVPVTYDLLTALEAARARRPVLARLALLVEAREAGIEVERAGYRPDLALVGGYKARKNFVSDRFSDSDHGWVVGVQSSWAVFDGRSTAGRVQQARSRLEQARLELEETQLAIEVAVRSALSSLQEATELAEAAVKGVGQAEEALRLADARYVAGSATQLDVLEARVALTEARDNQLQANYSYNVALATLRTAISEPDGSLTKE